MLEDDQIAPLSLLKKYIILNPELTIESESEEVKEFFKEVILEECDQPFKAYALEQFSHFDYGNSLSEPIFERRNIAGWGERIVLKTIKTRAPHSIEYHQYPNGDVRHIIQHSDGKILPPFKPDKFLHLINNPKFSNPYGKSDLTAGVYRAWYGKKILIRFLNIFLERFGAPALITYYSAKTSKSVKDRLQSLLPTISEKAGIMLPDDTKIETISVRSSGRNPFIDAIMTYNMMIARALLVPDLAGYGGSETTGGSYALGEEQYKAWYTTLELPKDIYLRQLNRKIIQPLIRWNFGDKEARFSRAVLRGENGKESRENAKLFLEALNSRSIRPTLEATNTFLRSIDYPEIPETEWEKGGEIIPSDSAGSAPAVQGKGPEQQPEPPATDRADKSEGKGNRKTGNKLPPEEVSAFQQQQFSSAGFGRDLSVYERRIDFAALNSGITSIERKYGQLLHGRQTAIIDRLAGYVARKRIIEDKRMDLIRSLHLPGREEELLKKDLIRMLIDASNDGTAAARQDIESRQKDFEASFSTGPVDAPDVISSLNIDDDEARHESLLILLRQSKAAEEMAQWIDTSYTNLVTGESAMLLSVSRDALMEGIRSGLTQVEIEKLIREKTQDQASKARIMNIVRSNVARAWSGARLHEYQSLPQGDITGYQVSAIMDHRTSPVCRKLDGKIIKPEEVNRLNPPYHYQCRSLLIPVFQEEPKPEFSPLPDVEQEPGGYLRLKESA